MRFEYNSNLTFDERVRLVVKEIKDEYPLIRDEDAYEAAALASPINTERLENNDKFDRYYFLLHTIRRNGEEFDHVFNDAFNLYQKGLNEKNSNMMLEIINYVIGDRDTFPELYPAN